MKNLIILICIFFPFFSFALSIDTMVKIADDNGEGTYTVQNNEKYPVFVNVKLAKMSIINNKLKKIFYNKDNILMWEASVSQNKFILDAGKQKYIGIRALCSDSCDENQDSVFSAQFTPTPYSKDGKPVKGVSINYGYESIFIVPAKNKQISYSITRTDDKVKIENMSNTTIEAFFNQCTGMFKSDCSVKTVLLPGNTRNITLPKNARQNKVNTHISSIDKAFYKKEILRSTDRIKFSKKIDV
ncbi:hypothetical protein A9D46_18025 [Photobacterium damselae subsp. damselae]|uniref:hypothetical protein n=1 Tax=Photobacterium damselae TaxID=38293 RepID=UPI00084BB927|nr:hypothetical protein [Photobacterium damselae]OEC81429.1 hypothetical protein A9D46_18025 [Photobacterium damselae subsp. damselae]